MFIRPKSNSFVFSSFIALLFAALVPHHLEAKNRLKEESLNELLESSMPDTFLPTSSTESDGHDCIFEGIARENLKTLTGLDATIRSSDAIEKRAQRKSYEVLFDTLSEQINLPSKERRRITFMLFSHYEKLHPFEKNSVLDATTWQDLELLCGPKSDVRHYAAAKLFFTTAEAERAQTEAGRVMFFKKLIEPTDDKNVLLTNQSIIKELHANEQLFKKIEKQIARLKQAEGVILSLWNDDSFYDAIKQDELHVPGAKRASNYVNKSPWLVEMNAYVRLFTVVTANAMMVSTLLFLPAKAFGLVDGPHTPDFLKSHIGTLEAGAVGSFAGLVFLTSNWLNNAPKATNYGAAQNTALGITTGYPALFFPDYFHHIINFRKCIQTKLLYTARYIDALEKISQITKSNPMLKEQFPALANVENELKEMSKLSKDFAQFMYLIKTSTFKGTRASFFSWYGRINVCYQALHKIKNTLIHPMMVVGELDAYMSCARLVKELESQNVPVCFPTYIEATEPTLTITDFWNPSVIGRKAVTNSITIGGHQQPKNIIVTGPNAGGKSTTMKGLLVNAVLAQTFGIATARSFVFTPFSKIITYLNITDDIAAGKSHFKAGACRARELISTVQSANRTQFTLTAVDEVFNGTTFYEGQAAAYALIEQLSTFPNNICVTITHFPQVPRLEQEYPKKFANYKVTVSFNPDGSMNYPYRIERGVSEQNIALEILKIEGFNDTFLNKATQILAQNPETKGK